MVVVVAAGGCRVPHVTDLFKLDQDLALHDMLASRPRTRVGSLATSTVSTPFRGCSNLGRHSYRYNVVEKNGIVYTCSGGHLDIAHLRNSADWTAHLSALAYYQMKEGVGEFSFELDEDTGCHVHVDYPPDWDCRDDADKALLLYDVATGLGRYFAYHASIWHEIVTWFGYKSTGFYSEFASAFSWEDMYSNLLGCHIGYAAMYDTQHTFDEAVTLGLQAELKKLGPQPKNIARHASDLVRGQWFSGEQPAVIMMGRNFDIGLDDGRVTPWLVPDLTACLDAQPHLLDAPKLDFLAEHGFAVRFEVEPRLWEKTRILAILYPNGEKHERFEPARQLHVVMDYIRRDGARRYGTDLAVVHSD